MADINAPIVYSAEFQAIIKEKLADPSFKHQNWKEDDLLAFRSVVRDYYREVQLGNCAFCKGPASIRSAQNCQVEHIVPKSIRREFIFEPKNLCVICADCNEIKRAQEVMAQIPETLVKGDGVKRYPKSSKAFLIVHPHFDDWDHHIIKFGQLYVDLSDKGSFTISACVLNRKIRKFGWEAVITDEGALRSAVEAWLTAKDSITAGRYLQIMRRLLITT